MHHGEAKASPASRLLGGIEWFGRQLASALVHPVAGVFNGDPGVAAWGQTGRVSGGDDLLAAADGQGSTIGHRIPGIHGQIEQRQF